MAIAKEERDKSFHNIKAMVEDITTSITDVKDQAEETGKKIGKLEAISPILKLIEGVENRKARFEACIAFHDGKEVRTFKGACEGKIAEKELGKGGFGYDPIFVPKGESPTFAESIELKNKYSHRYKSLLELIRYLKKL